MRLVLSLTLTALLCSGCAHRWSPCDFRNELTSPSVQGLRDLGMEPHYPEAPRSLSAFYEELVTPGRKWRGMGGDAEDRNAPIRSAADRAVRSSHGVSEIALERTACYGVCPGYLLVLQQDGAATLIGDRNTCPAGRYRGIVWPAQFDALALLVDRLGYFDLEAQYTTGISDTSTVFTSVVRNGQRKVIRHYARAGPPELAAFEVAVDAVREQIVWTRR
jgi:hypothetical protein